MRDLVSAVILLGALQGAVLAPVLWARRANTLANRILGTLVAVVAAMLLLGDLQHRFAFAGHPHLLALGGPLPYLFAPLLYLYVVALTRPVVRFDPRWLVHALPFAVFVIYMTQVFYLRSGEEKLALARAADTGSGPASYHLLILVEILVALAYLAFTWRALARYGRKMRGWFSDLARIDLRWLRALVIVHISVWVAVLVAAVLKAANRAPELATAIDALFVSVGASIAIFLTGYVSLWQPELAPKATVAQPPKYQRNRIDEDEAKGLAARLESLMVDKQLYRDAALTLPMLADALAVTPHTLSQILNVRHGKSFFVFVNAYRADALKALLLDPKNEGRGVLELGLEVGFNSKSTLNAFFKKHTGMTPTELRRRAKSKG